MSTPVPSEMPDDDVSRPNSPDDTGLSCAASTSTNHITPPAPLSPPPTPVVDPGLFNTVAPNHSALALTQNSAPRSPNSYTTGLEREPSPLSNPPDEEPFFKTINAPSSTTRKRKSSKNSLGKGKAPPRQKRRPTEGSQSRSAHI